MLSALFSFFLFFCPLIEMLALHMLRKYSICPGIPAVLLIFTVFFETESHF